MYFAINNFYGGVTDHEYDEVKKLLEDFSEIEIIDFDQFRRYYHLSIKNLRKLRMKSLFDENARKKCSELEKLINNEKLIYKYGDKQPVFSSSTTGTSGSSGSRSTNRSTIKIVPNKFVKNISKKFDFHKVSNKRFK